MKTIAAITTARNDALFVEKWIDYYGAQFGHCNLYLILDGHDQPTPQNAQGVNILRLPHQPKERVPAMRRRANVMSRIGQGLHQYFDIVIATDVDEFLVLDPKVDQSLVEYLSAISSRSSVSGLGLDVAQHLRLEDTLDPSQRFLTQRRFAHVSARYTKPSTSFKPLRWGSGIHRVKGRNFYIDPNLYHFHFGMIDYARATGKTADKDRLATGWGEHLARREKVFEIVTENTAIDGDDYFATARKLQSLRRPLYALNKPAMIKGDPVVTIPARFRNLV